MKKPQMSVTGFAVSAEQVGLALSLTAILFFRRNALPIRGAFAALSVLLLLVLPVVMALNADRIAFDTIARVLVLAALNGVLIAVWAMLSRVPSSDIAGLGVVCLTSTIIVVVLLLDALTPPRMF